MANLNKVLLIGRLTRDPELRSTPSGLAIAAMGLAVNRFRKAQDGSRIEETAFIDVTAFGRTAELAQQYLKKGRQVFVEGALHFEQWDDKTTGQKRSKLTVTVETLQFLDGRGEGSGEGGDSSQESGRDYGGGRGYSNTKPAANDYGDQSGGRPNIDDTPF